MRLSGFISELREELGDELVDFIGESPFERWINSGQARLKSFLRKTAAVSWDAGDTLILLPGDWHHADEFIPAVGSCSLPPGRVWGSEYVFDEPAIFGGAGVYRYYAKRPRITGSVESTLDDEGNEALISYALYRFFKRLSSSRADYRMYATITQANGVDIDELEGVSERHLQDFKDAQDALEPPETTLFYVD